MLTFNITLFSRLLSEVDTYVAKRRRIKRCITGKVIFITLSISECRTQQAKYSIYLLAISAYTWHNRLCKSLLCPSSLVCYETMDKHIFIFFCYSKIFHSVCKGCKSCKHNRLPQDWTQVVFSDAHAQTNTYTSNRLFTASNVSVSLSLVSENTAIATLFVNYLYTCSPTKLTILSLYTIKATLHRRCE